MSAVSFRPSQLTLQWHLSDACNLRCTHCYQEDFEPEEFGLAEWLRFLDDYLAFLAGSGGESRIGGHINVTGGEPFALRDFPALLDVFAKHRAQFGFAILSNGTLIDSAVAHRLRKWRPRFVQVSLDGMPVTHDRIRGAGSHARAIAGIQALLAENIPVLIAFTAQPDNYREFGEVARLGRELGVMRVWSDRVIPAAGPEAVVQTLSREQTAEYLQIMARAQAENQQGGKTELPLQRALQFLDGGSSIYQCTAGESLITVMPDGTLYPCRRLPIAAGNVYQQPLSQLYSGNVMQDVRRPRSFAGCEDCGFAQVCQGGLRCLAWAVHGSLDQADPGCPLAREVAQKGAQEGAPAVARRIIPIRAA
jgi:radical SAM protein with 4Fe4S-binding SPASM domain